MQARIVAVGRERDELALLVKELDRIGKWLDNWRDAHKYTFPSNGVPLAMRVQQLATKLHHSITSKKEMERKRESDLEDERNIGAELGAERLCEIAETGEHRGTFGGKKMEACAKAVVALHAKAKRPAMGFGQGKDK
jgi:hypothetical protein